MTSTRGPLFTTSSSDLAPWAAELNPFLTRLRSELRSDLLELRPSRTGLGVFVRRGRSVRRGTRLVAFWGELTLDPHSRSHYVFELPAARLRGRRCRVRPYVDARLACLRGDPPADQAAMLNHCCHVSDPRCRRPGPGTPRLPFPSWSASPAASCAAAPSSPTITMPASPSDPSPSTAWRLLLLPPVTPARTRAAALGWPPALGIASFPD
jgi:hypothetical protein